MDPVRRRLVHAAATGALAAPLAAWSLPRAGGAAAPRHDLATPAGAEALRAFAAAVAMLRALPVQDPRGWRAQVLRHREFCPHANWWLLPWHRAFVHYFEASCADVLGEPAFRLPYWDWSRQRRIPALFLSPRSPLFHRNRSAAPGAALADKVVGRAVLQRLVATPLQALIYGGATTGGDQRETALAGELEATPHNAVHQFVGGDMADMLSPLDPLFWVHHANVDRLWASWLRQHDGAMPADPRWGSRALDEFHDPASGATATPTAAETVLSPAFDARYDRYELPLARARAGASGDGARRLDLATAADLPRLAATGDADGVARPALRLRFATAAADRMADPNAAALLVLQGLLPDGATAMALAADIGDGAQPMATVAFFGAGAAHATHAGPPGHAGHAGHGAAHGDGTTAMVIDATAAARAARRAGRDLVLVLAATAVDGPVPPKATIALRRAALVATG